MDLPSAVSESYPYPVHPPDSPPAQDDQIRNTLSGGIGRLAALDRRGPAWIALLVLTALALVCGFYGSSIHIDTRLRALLPGHTPSLVAIEKVSQAQGATDQLTVAVQGANQAQTRRLGAALAQELEAWPEVQDLSFELDLTPFRDHLLYWVEPADLEALDDAMRVKRAQAIAEQTRAGLSDLAIPGSAVVVDQDDWESEYEDQPQKAPIPQSQDAADFESRIEAMREQFLSDPRLRRSQAQAIWPQAWTKQALQDPKAQPAWQSKVGAPIQSEDGTIALITARMSRPPTDIAFVRALQDRFASALAKVQASLPAQDKSRAQLVGGYAISGDVDMIMVDLRNATALSIALVVGVLVLGFGTWRGLIVVLAPVLVSMGLTLALARLIFGELNVLTAFLFAVLFGMGVDFSVHLYMQRIQGQPYPSWTARIAAHFRPLASTMLTTAGAMLALCFGEFQAFQEFGLISALGVSTCFLAALIMVPALDTLLGSPRASTPKARPLPRRFAPWLRWSTVALVLAVCTAGLGKLSFETNTRNLRAPKAPGADRDVIPYGRAQGEDRTSVPTILYSEDPAKLQSALKDLEGEPWVKSLVSISTILPKQQSAKQEKLRNIHETSTQLKGETKDYHAALTALQTLSASPPIKAEDLPEWTRTPFATHDGRIDRIAHAHLAFAAHDLNQVQDVVRKLRALLAPHEVMAATTSFIFADLGTLITLDSQRLPAIAIAIIALCLWIDLRRLGPTLACMLTLLLGLALSLSLLGLLDIRINFFNLAVLPAVVGLGIDASIHLWHAKGRPLGATGRASLVAGATTCAAFAGLLAATHPGLASMAKVGLISIGACVGTAFLLLAGHSHEQAKS